MFIDNYLDEIHQKLLRENYTEKYLELVNEKNFLAIYSLLEFLGFYYIDDIIVRYLELFSLEKSYVLRKILELKNKMGDNYIIQIGDDLSILKGIIDGE